MNFDCIGDATILNVDPIYAEAGIATALIKIGENNKPVTITASSKIYETSNNLYTPIILKKLLFLIVLVCQYSFTQQPNIVFLLADDLGFGEIGAYGQKEIQTPVLDSLAKAGIRFTNAYAGSPVCSPSRAVLMTGITSSKNTIRGNQGYDYKNKRLDRIPLKPTDITIAEVLKEAGYQTGFIGKWHLDHPNQLDTWAHARGFDYAVQEQWASPYEGKRYDEQMHWINGKQDSIYFNLKDWSCKDEFRTTLAFDYLNSVDRQKPFFLFMSYRAPHGHGRVNSPNLYKDKGWPEKERKHAAKITLLDQQIGRLIHKLKTMGVLDNTIVFFTSDNGPTSEGHDVHFFNSSGFLKGHKRDTYEGGIRVPFMVNWHKKKNQTRLEIVSSQDKILCPHWLNWPTLKHLNKSQEHHSYQHYFLKIVYKDPIFIGSFKV